MDTRKMKQEARKFRTIRDAWFWVPTVLYAVALIACFICNLAVNHTLSWFFVVLAALICAFTFVPTVSCFFETKNCLLFLFQHVCLFACFCSLVRYTPTVYLGS